MYYFLKKILKLETEFLEEPEALSVSDTNPAEIAAEETPATEEAPATEETAAEQPVEEKKEVTARKH